MCIRPIRLRAETQDTEGEGVEWGSQQLLINAAAGTALPERQKYERKRRTGKGEREEGQDESERE